MTTNKPQQMPHISGLDGLRAIAILAVILWHCASEIGVHRSEFGMWETVFMSGWAGVDLFFVLSGFLITSILLHEEQQNELAGIGSQFSLRRFYIRRCFRIMPPYFFVIALNILILPHLKLFESVDFDRDAVMHTPEFWLTLAAFGMNYYLIHVGAFVGAAYIIYWSLAVEEHFYIFWSTLLKVVKKNSARIAAAGVICLFLCVYRFLGKASGDVRGAEIFFSSHFRVDSLLWGCLGALTFPSFRRFVTARRTVLPVLAAIIYLLMSTGNLSLIPGGSPIGISVGLTFLAVTCLLLVIEVADRPASLLTKTLELKPFVAIGKVSYGMYLLHFQCKDLANFILKDVTWTAPVPKVFAIFSLCTLMTFGAAWCMYRFLEAWFLKKGRSLAGSVGLRSPDAATDLRQGA